jgi:hypothetical protein
MEKWKGFGLESSNFEPGLQAKYPEIRAFAGKSVDNPGSTIRFSFSPYGVQTMVFRPNTGSEFIEPYTKDNSVYVLLIQTRIIGQLPFELWYSRRCIKPRIIRFNYLRTRAVIRFIKR